MSRSEIRHRDIDLTPKRTSGRRSGEMRRGGGATIRAILPKKITKPPGDGSPGHCVAREGRPLGRIDRDLRRVRWRAEGARTTASSSCENALPSHFEPDPSAALRS